MSSASAAMASLPLAPGLTPFTSDYNTYNTASSRWPWPAISNLNSTGVSWSSQRASSVVAMASYEVKLLMPDGQQHIFTAPDDDYILDTAEDKGVELPSSCRSGACSACCAKLVEGKVDQSDGSFLSDAQIKAGYVLTCVAYPLSDVVLKTHLESEVK